MNVSYTKHTKPDFKISLENLSQYLNTDETDRIDKVTEKKYMDSNRIKYSNQSIFNIESTSHLTSFREKMHNNQINSLMNLI